MAATAAAVQGVADPGVEAGLAGEQVYSVSPTGFAWAAGIRSGQIVQALGDSSVGPWRIETIDAVGHHAADSRERDRLLSSSLWIGVCSAIFAAFAIVFLRTHRRWAAPAAAAALVAASIPIGLEGAPIPSTLVLGAAVAVPIASITMRAHGRARSSLLAILSALVVAWAIVRLAGVPYAETVESARSSVALWAVVALVLERGWAGTMSGGQALRVLRPRLFDVGVILAIVSAAAVVSIFLHIHPLVTATLVVLLLAVVPAARRRLGRQIEDVLFADLREQAAAEATERERARLARELHDVPLQELVAVIRRLEIQPGAEAETEDLRSLASHLRNVATELRPPVLDDLGLPAALDYLAEETSTAAVPVTATVDDQTSFGADRRPPTDVELAMYRIASEAVANAIRHSGGSSVAIEAAVAPGRVELLVVDDGAGLARERAREAARGKRLGLISMRQRAEAVDAELSIDGSPRGTRVRVVWQA